MVAAFRCERSLARSNRGDDYMLGRTRLLWCAHAHRTILPTTRAGGAVPPRRRSCLSHYKVQARGHVSCSRSTRRRCAREAEAAGCRSAERDLSGDRKQRGRKRARCADKRRRERQRRGCRCGRGRAEGIDAAGLRAPGTPWAPQRARRPVARALSHRQAALECRRLASPASARSKCRRGGRELAPRAKLAHALCPTRTD